MHGLFMGIDRAENGPRIDIKYLAKLYEMNENTLIKMMIAQLESDHCRLQQRVAFHHHE